MGEQAGVPVGQEGTHLPQAGRPSRRADARLARATFGEVGHALGVDAQEVTPLLVGAGARPAQQQPGRVTYDGGAAVHQVEDSGPRVGPCPGEPARVGAPVRSAVQRGAGQRRRWTGHRRTPASGAPFMRCSQLRTLGPPTPPVGVGGGVAATSPAVPSPAVPSLRVATFNLLHGMALTPAGAGAGGLREAAASLDVDVVGLQEVDRYQDRSGGVDQTQLVAETVGAPYWRFVPALHGTPGPPADWRPAAGAGESTAGPSYGIGLASRLAVVHWRVRRFGPAPVALPLLAPGGRSLMRVRDEPRLALAAVVAPPGGEPFTVATTHLSFVPGFNARQLLAITRWLGALPRPRLLLGDLNLPGRVPAALTGWQQLGRVPTYPAYRPRVQFDHVLADGVDTGAVARVRALALPVSDHCALVVDLDI
jgi:endonuclease/exonuclease/phosphatase family metal-dependent hydrolase